MCAFLTKRYLNAVWEKKYYPLSPVCYRRQVKAGVGAGILTDYHHLLKVGTEEEPVVDFSSKAHLFIPDATSL